MSDTSAAFTRMEAMIRKHAPLLMKVGDALPTRKPTDRRVSPRQRPRITKAEMALMFKLRKQGMTIGDIARKIRVSWHTVQKKTKAP